MGEIIAERRIAVTGRAGDTSEVIVRFGKPHPDPLSTNGDWCCPFQIHGLGDDSVEQAFGVDSLQALLLAVWSVRLQLADRAEQNAVRLDWLEQTELGLHVVPDVVRLPPAPAGQRQEKEAGPG
ncbi:DUF6968 family protein [Micromonospora phaseoli]|uniref:DUF6968 family protein n=1 Tax=Micromonospora phaseoli TaxID=1144548 RepID=UPI001587147C|nr:hypothetical protein [Micromonospora phaseoli]